VVTHQLQVERRMGKDRQSETDVLPLCPGAPVKSGPRQSSSATVRLRQRARSQWRGGPECVIQRTSMHSTPDLRPAAAAAAAAALMLMNYSRSRTRRPSHTVPYRPSVRRSASIHRAGHGRQITSDGRVTKDNNDSIRLVSLQPTG